MNLKLALRLVDGRFPENLQLAAWRWLRDTGITRMMHGSYIRRLRHIQKAGKI